MSYPCPSPGHTYDFRLGSGAIILQGSLGSGRWHHLTACSTSSREHALLQHANALNFAAAKASLYKRTGPQKRMMFCAGGCAASESSGVSMHKQMSMQHAERPGMSKAI